MTLTIDSECTVLGTSTVKHYIINVGNAGYEQ